MIPKTLVRHTALAVALLPLAVQAGETNDWSFDVAPYLWLANVSMETSLPDTGQGGSGQVQEFESELSGGFMMAAQVRYRSFGLLAQFNWLQLDTEAKNPGPLYSSGDLQSDYIYSTAAFTYALPLEGRLNGKFHAEVLAGALLWHVATDLDLDSGKLPGVESSNSETWAAPLVGLNLGYDLTRHWRLLARGTAGGFIDSDIQWDVFGGVGYQFNHWCMATVGYRYLLNEHNNDDFTVNTEAHGVLLGVVFGF
jgi:hypothetical protein